ncbi:hypothetical protein NPIL_624391, partial [Nephila pilipes]
MKLFIALAPVASGTYISSAVRFLAPFAKDLQ